MVTPRHHSQHHHPDAGLTMTMASPASRPSLINCWLSVASAMLAVSRNQQQHLRDDQPQAVALCR
jgi:hypothetical protein